MTPLDLIKQLQQETAQEVKNAQLFDQNQDTLELAKLLGKQELLLHAYEILDRNKPKKK